DIDVGAASAERGLPYILSSQGSSPMEATAAAMDTASVTGTASVTATASAAASALRWFQLYWSKDEPLVDSFIARAEAIDAGALVVTLDTTTLGWRPWDLRSEERRVGKEWRYRGSVGG